MLAVTTGHIDAGEEPMQALLREVSEEVGINDLNPLNGAFVNLNYPLPSVKERKKWLEDNKIEFERKIK